MFVAFERSFQDKESEIQKKKINFNNIYDQLPAKFVLLLNPNRRR